MTHSFSFGKIELVASTEAADLPTRPDPGTPFHILVIGDLSGRANRGLVEASPGLAKRQTLRIDRDNFDCVLAGLDVELRLPIPGDEHNRIALQFTALSGISS